MLLSQRQALMQFREEHYPDNNLDYMIRAHLEDNCKPSHHFKPQTAVHAFRDQRLHDTVITLTQMLNGAVLMKINHLIVRPMTLSEFHAHPPDNLLGISHTHIAKVPLLP